MLHKTRRFSKRWLLQVNIVDLFISYVLFFPPILQALGKSYSLGIIFCAFSLTPFFSKLIFSGVANVRTFLLASFFVVYSPTAFLLGSMYFSGPNLLRWVLGLLVIMSIMILASIFAHIYEKALRTQKFHSNKFQIFSALAIYSHVILFLRFAEFSPLYLKINSPLGFFSEPSHVAYVTCIFLFLKSFLATRRMFALYMLGAIIFVISIESLVGIAALFCVAFALASRLKKIFVILVFFMVVILVQFIDFEPLKNLTFILDTGINLTAAVYLSGWERAFLNLMETNGLGLGVNQFGVYGDQGTFGDLIIRRAGYIVNSFDGSFIFAKLTGEFGLFALLVTAYLLHLWRKCYSNTRYMNNAFSLGIVSSFLILFFFRAPGYACGASALLVAICTNPKLMKHELQSSNAKLRQRQVETQIRSDSKHL